MTNEKTLSDSEKIVLGIIKVETKKDLFDKIINEFTKPSKDELADALDSLMEKKFIELEGESYKSLKDYEKESWFLESAEIAEKEALKKVKM